MHPCHHHGSEVKGPRQSLGLLWQHATGAMAIPAHRALRQPASLRQPSHFLAGVELLLPRTECVTGELHVPSAPVKLRSLLVTTSKCCTSCWTPGQALLSGFRPSAVNPEPEAALMASASGDMGSTTSPEDRVVCVPLFKKPASSGSVSALAAATLLEGGGTVLDVLEGAGDRPGCGDAGVGDAGPGEPPLLGVTAPACLLPCSMPAVLSVLDL